MTREGEGTENYIYGFEAEFSLQWDELSKIQPNMLCKGSL